MKMHTQFELIAPGGDRSLLAAESKPTSLWHLLYVKSRQEKQLSDDLTAMGIANYVPVTRQTRYYGRRKSTLELPLFPGYVFLHGSLDDAYMADRTKRVVSIIKVANQRQIIWELENIRAALSCDAELAPHPFLREGMRVEVRSGPFRGLQGVIESRARADRLILQVEMLARAVGLEIDASILDPM
jgi:transcription termination/antitermination protein NusG